MISKALKPKPKKKKKEKERKSIRHTGVITVHRCVYCTEPIWELLLGKEAPAW